LLGAREFYTEQLLRDLRDLGPELDELEKRGFIAPDENITGGWRVRPAALLWWLSAELVKIVRPDTPFEEWFKAQDWEGLLTHGEKQQLETATRAVVNLLAGSASKLVEAVIKKVLG
jgi:hypothetical protein